MTEQNECSNCETEYSIRWIPLMEPIDGEEDEDLIDDVGYPKFCPFCGCAAEEEDDMDIDE